MSIHNDQLKKIQTETGFLAALDQSGGSTPKALKLYGVEESAYSNESEMFDLIHGMRSRIMTSPSFDGSRVLGAILFEMTMEREVQGMPSARYLWQEKNVVPFLKVDKGLADEANGVQLMKPMPELDALCDRAVKHEVFGTKMRSVIKLANPEGIAAIVKQQFEVGNQILSHGLCPILEPEVDIHSPEKAAAEAILKKELLAHLDALPEGKSIMVKLTLPEENGFYDEVIQHAKMLKVVALSGGYSRDEANSRLTANHGMIASFSRALTQGLSATQSDSEFNGLLDSAIESICQASRT